jgi:citrate synthase
MTVAADASSPKTRAALYLATRATTDAPCLGRRPMQLAGEALDLVAGFGAAVAGQDVAGRPVHEALARLWKLKPAHRDLVRRALVLVADHELNPSTFAARVAASTGASLAAAALAGFATLCGPLHGEASARAVLFLETAQREGAHAAINATLARAERPPATGHALYPEGDPRAAALLAALPLSAPVADAIRAAEATAAARANIDMALAALTVELGLPRDAPFLIFACGRMAGWLAHAIEQTTTGRIIRPRATYVGP